MKAKLFDKSKKNFASFFDTQSSLQKKQLLRDLDHSQSALKSDKVIQDFPQNRGASTQLGKNGAEEDLLAGSGKLKNQKYKININPQLRSFYEEDYDANVNKDLKLSS